MQTVDCRSWDDPDRLNHKRKAPLKATSLNSRRFVHASEQEGGSRDSVKNPNYNVRFSKAKSYSDFIENFYLD